MKVRVNDFRWYPVSISSYLLSLTASKLKISYNISHSFSRKVKVEAITSFAVVFSGGHGPLVTVVAGLAGLTGVLLGNTSRLTSIGSLEVLH